MFWKRQAAQAEELAALRQQVADLAASLERLRADLAAARLDYGELAAKAYRWLKGAQAARARAEELTEEQEQEQQRLDLVPEIPAGTPLRNTRLARASSARRSASSGE